MKRSGAAVLGAAAAMTLVLAGCSGDDSSDSSGGAATLTLAGWSLTTTPEFKTLADGFKAANPGITVQLKEYDAANYDTQMIADIAPAAPTYVEDLKNFYTYQRQAAARRYDVAGQAGRQGRRLAKPVDGKCVREPAGRTPGCCSTTRRVRQGRIPTRTHVPGKLVSPAKQLTTS